MMDMPPPELDEVEPYDVPRGTCPACGSGNVKHLVIGMTVNPSALDSAPAWAESAGCLHPGHNRECGSCGLEWLDNGE